MGIRVRAFRDNQHVGQAGGAADQPVQCVRGLAGDAERIDHHDVLPQLTTGAGGDGVVLALEVQHEGGAGIGQQVRDDRPDALAGAGRGASQDVPVLPEPGIAPARDVRHEAKREAIGGGGRGEVARADRRRPEMRRTMRIEGEAREQERPQAAKRAGQQPMTPGYEQGGQDGPQREDEPL